VKGLKEEILYDGSIKESGGTMYGVSEWGELYFTHADNNGAVVDITPFATRRVGR
jgi:hypothetical protein